MIKAYDKAVASFKVKWVLCGVCVYMHMDCFGLFLSLMSCFVCQNALKGEDEPQDSKKNQPGKKRKNNKKNQSRKRTNADKEVCSWN